MGGCAVYDVGLQLLECWDHGFESHRGHGCPSLVFVVCCACSGLSDELFTRSEKCYRVCRIAFDLETSTTRRPRLAPPPPPQKKKKSDHIERQLLPLGTYRGQSAFGAVNAFFIIQPNSPILLFCDQFYRVRPCTRVLQVVFVFSVFFNQTFVWMSLLVRAAFSSHRILLDLIIAIQRFSPFVCLRHAWDIRFVSRRAGIGIENCHL